VTPVVPGTPEKKKTDGDLPMPKEKKKPAEDTSVRARLTVELPQGARLFVDGSPVKATSAKRSFITPPLQAGQTYYYDLRAEMIRDGQTVAVSRRVLVRPGQEAHASFPELQETTPVAVPAGDQ
jgi:uncharacterized protein (TIGR03000 family)